MPPKRKRPQENGPTESKVKRISRDAAGLPELSVALTGAREGDLLSGTHKDTEGSILRVVDGRIYSVPCFSRGVSTEDMVKAVAKYYSISFSLAEQQVRDIPTPDEPDRDNAQPLGRSCRHTCHDDSCECESEAKLCIVQPGALQEHANAAGFGEKMEHYVRSQATVTWRDILRTMGKKTLVLRPKLWRVVVGPVKMKREDARGTILSTDVLLTEEEIPLCEVYQICDKLISLPLSAREFSWDDVLSACEIGLNDLPEGVLDAASLREDLEKTIQVLRPITIGSLKSMMQKTIRFGARQVGIPNEAGEEILVPCVVFVAVTVAGLFACKGQFSPELQLFSRGCTSALKRIAVIMAEDGWPEHKDAPEGLMALLALSLATQYLPHWHPPRSIIHGTIRLAAMAASSSCIGTWRNAEASPSYKRKSKEFPLTEVQQNALAHVGELLELVRSFKGDIMMMHDVAKQAKRKPSRLDLRYCEPEDHPAAMPMAHGWDQHVSRGIAHLLPPSFGNTFPDRFKRLFGRITGMNPRLVDCVRPPFEEREEVRHARFAQQLINQLAVGRPSRRMLDEPTKQSFLLPLDPGTLAAAVGPISVHVETPGATKRSKAKSRRVLVILGTVAPEEEVVMLPPSERNPKDLYGGVTDAEKDLAIGIARSKKFDIHSKLLGDGEVTYSHTQHRWLFDGTIWMDIQREGRKCSVPRVPTPAWIGHVSLDDDDAVRSSMQEIGTGMIEDAENVVRELVKNMPRDVVHRARSMIQQQYQTVAMPVPTLQGGQRGDQLMPYPGDWNAFRLLVLLSRLVPGALRLDVVPRFSVPDVTLLRMLERWMIVEDRKETTNAQEANRWATHAAWKAMEAVREQSLMPHQSYAVNQMLERDSQRGVPGHYLVMDTGLGKTRTALCYLHHRLSHTSLGDDVKFILWVAPKSTVEDLVRSIGDTTKEYGGQTLPAFQVPRTAKKDKTVALREYHVNVIDSDFMRVLIQLNLPAVASQCVVVFDEVDTMYEPTQRTSACRRLAKLVPVFVAQTATPMNKNVTHLASWLADTEQYPVDDSNYLVAASGMVSLQVSLNITMEEIVHKVPLDPEVRVGMRKYIAERSSSQWLKLADLTQRQTDVAMCDKAVELINEDRKDHPNGGILMVAHSLPHANRLVKMMVDRKIRSGLFEDLHDSSVSCVVVTQKQDRGYNGATRLKGIVKGVYAGNGASRHQMRGRVRRMGQKRDTVLYVTVLMEHSMLELLHERQQRADSINISLQELAHEFEHSSLNAFFADDSEDSDKDE